MITVERTMYRVMFLDTLHWSAKSGPYVAVIVLKRLPFRHLIIDFSKWLIRGVVVVENMEL